MLNSVIYLYFNSVEFCNKEKKQKQKKRSKLERRKTARDKADGISSKTDWGYFVQ